MPTRHEELLALFQAHFAAELENDVEKTLATCTSDIVYEHPFRLGVIQGLDAVRRYYTETWAARPFSKLEAVRSWLIGDDTLAVEVDTTFGTTAEPGDHVRTLCIGTFRDGRISREIVYTGPPLP